MMTNKNIISLTFLTGLALTASITMAHSEPDGDLRTMGVAPMDSRESGTWHRALTRGGYDAARKVQDSYNAGRLMEARDAVGVTNSGELG